MSSESESIHVLFERVWRQRGLYGMRYLARHPLPVLSTGSLPDVVRLRLIKENLLPNPPNKLFCYAYLSDGSKLILIPQRPFNAYIHYNPEAGLLKSSRQIGWQFHHYNYTPGRDSEVYQLAGMSTKDQHDSPSTESMCVILQTVLEWCEILTEQTAART